MIQKFQHLFFILFLIVNVDVISAGDFPQQVNCHQQNATRKEATLWQKFTYIIGKIPEAGLIFDPLTLQMAKWGMTASKERSNSRLEIVRLDQLRQYHPVKGIAMEKTQQRINALRNQEDQLLAHLPILQESYDQIIPSIDPIQTVVMEKNYLVIQGQGRVVALKDVFPPETTIEVEVSEVSDNTREQLIKIRNEFQKRGDLTSND